MPGLKTKIAIVDDDKSVRRAMARFLAASSFQVRCYASAHEFLVALESEKPDCLIVDLRMPGMTGLELLHHLAGSGPSIPTIAVTGDDEPGLRHRCELAGASLFLTKPVPGETLLSAIRAVMKRGQQKNQTTDC